VKQKVDILITLSTFGEYSNEPLRMIDESLFSYRINETGKRMNPDRIIEIGKDCVGVIAGVENYDGETLEKLTKLCCISRVGAGIDNIDLVFARKKGIAVLNTADTPIAAVAELTLGMMLALLRRLPEVNDLMHRRKWQRIPGRLLSEKTVGIIGLGRIGRRVAELVSAFGARVIGADPNPDNDWRERQGVDILPLMELLSRSDIVTNHASGSVDTPVFLGKTEFYAMKQGAWFINMARGNMIDDEALFAAIDSEYLCGAGLDVYPEEPYTGPLCDHPRVILFPHQATLAVETRIAMENGAVRNLIQYLKNSI
jgi:D-3-phosphoglycerate dehydrogenase|tara:strand:+ start:36879 stop:37817 length:939 start_codon:yes stop_codon:yes gene_type:complete